MKGIVIVWLLLLITVSSVIAANDGPLITSTTTSGPPPTQVSNMDQLAQNAVDLRVSEANRYLSAEVSRQITSSSNELLDRINANNDQNFQTFDNNMKQYMVDLKQKVIIGGIGAILLANALIGLAYLYVTRRYSYEHFLEKQLDQHIKLQKETPQFQQTTEMEKGLAELQQQNWAPQPAPETMSTTFGNVVASQQTQMNAHQFQPAYDGAWKRNDEPISHVNWEAQHPDQYQQVQQDYQEYPQYPQEYQEQQQEPVYDDNRLEQPDFVHPFEEKQQQYRTKGYYERG